MQEALTISHGKGFGYQRKTIFAKIDVLPVSEKPSQSQDCLGTQQQDQPRPLPRSMIQYQHQAVKKIRALDKG